MRLRCRGGLCSRSAIFPLKLPWQHAGVSCCVLGAMFSILIILLGETNAMWFWACGTKQRPASHGAALQRVRRFLSDSSNLALPRHFFLKMDCVLLWFCAACKFWAKLMDQSWSKICCDASFCLSSICDLAIWPRCDGDLSLRLVCFLRFETCDASCDGIAAICDAMRGHAKLDLQWMSGFTMDSWIYDGFTLGFWAHKDSPWII